jgi:hypothetical protein
MTTVEIIIPCGVTTSKSVAWGGKNPELFQASQEAIRYAVLTSPHCTQLQGWLENRIKLSLEVEFYLSKRRVSGTDIDSLLSDLFNPLVEGACGPRAAGKPIPQTKDALFWRVSATKVELEDEQTIVRINLFEACQNE